MHYIWDGSYSCHSFLPPNLFFHHSQLFCQLFDSFLFEEVGKWKICLEALCFKNSKQVGKDILCKMLELANTERFHDAH